MAEKETTMEELAAIAKAMDSGKSLEEARESVVAPAPEPEEAKVEPDESQTDPSSEPARPKVEESSLGDDDSSLTGETEQATPDISREAKDMERKMRSWKTLNEEKGKLQKEREEFEQSKEKWRLRQLEETNEVRDEDGYSAMDYDKAANEFREDGETDLAVDAEEKASRLREQEREGAKKLQAKQFGDEFRRNYESARSKYPELGDHDSELFKRTEQVFLHYPELLGDSDGPRKAAWVASRDLMASKAETLQDENSQLRSELEEYKSKLSIGGSQPAPRPASREFMELKPEDRFRMLTDQAAQMDAH